MRFVNADGRASLLVDGDLFDVEELSGGTIGPDPRTAVIDRWDDVLGLADRGALSGGRAVSSARLGPPVPMPPLVLSVIANYPPTERADFPMIVGKSPTSVVGPNDDIVLPSPETLPLREAWVIPEPELGIVTRAAPRHLNASDAASFVAGFVVAQDVTERRHEFGSSPSPWTWSNLPAKTLGKSFDTFCPLGPALVTLDELDDPSSLTKRCWINDQLVFEHSTADLLWDAAELVSLVSSFMTLPAGLVCLSGCGGTIDGSPIPFLQAGDVVRTEIDGVGTMVNRCVADARAGGRVARVVVGPYAPRP
jgi:2-keto-4-pentenoate hydratase/2-oxohepta-3-ene-1,7-dioic acid hydratase in catechol pathway